MRAPSLTETVFCSTHAGVNAYIRALTFTKEGVAVTQQARMVPELISWEKTVADRAGLRRDYHGPAKPAPGISLACPYCGNDLIHECAACGLLFCTAVAKAQACLGCGHSGPSVPLDNPAYPPGMTPGRPDWRERVVDAVQETEPVVLRAIDRLEGWALNVVTFFFGKYL